MPKYISTKKFDEIKGRIKKGEKKEKDAIKEGIKNAKDKAGKK